MGHAKIEEEKKKGKEAMVNGDDTWPEIRCGGRRREEERRGGDGVGMVATGVVCPSRG